jgi:hypothetical protein
VHQHQGDVVGGLLRVSDDAVDDSSGRSSNRRTTTQRVVENSDGALSSPSVAIVSWSAEVSLSSASVSWARTADLTWTIVRSARNSSGPVTKVTRPSTSDAAGPAMAAASHVLRTADPRAT